MLNNHNKETILSRNYHKKYYSDKTTDPQVYAAPQLPLQCAKTIFHRLSVVHGIYSGTGMRVLSRPVIWWARQMQPYLTLKVSAVKLSRVLTPLSASIAAAAGSLYT